MPDSTPTRTAWLLLISLTLTACAPGPPRDPGVTPVLLFDGAGTSPNDVAAIETILKSSHLAYSTINSSQLNAMPESRMSQYRLLIVPGGNFIDMGNGLTEGATANVRNAVNDGLNYLGICAGGFLAGSLPSGSRSFNLTSGVPFPFHNFGTRKTAVTITGPDGSALDQYFEDGPQFTGWGQVVGKYPDGTPAIVEQTVGHGQVILTGFHPEAPESWRRGMTFTTPASADAAYTKSLIVTAFNRATLPHY